MIGALILGAGRSTTTPAFTAWRGMSSEYTFSRPSSLMAGSTPKIERIPNGSVGQR
jgi:hypothetical protein